MKKKLLLTGLLTLLVCGCTPVATENAKGEYKEGTYFGSYEEADGEKTLTTTAYVYVDETGMIKSVSLDCTYLKDGVYTTKKALGDDYGMKNVSANMGNIEGGAEWYEQAKTFEDKVVEEQGLDWLVWSDGDETKTDSVSGVTMKVNGFVKAINDALDDAK